MKKSLLLFLFSFSFLALNSQSEITYKNFGDGWAIPLNANTEVDMDEDGTVDFYINQYQDELGFSPIFAVGCFASPGEYEYTSFNARTLSRYEEGDLILMNEGNLYDYIDDGRGSAYSANGGFAEDWSNNEDVYIGVAMINPEPGSTGVRNGWIKVSINAENQELIIKEWAYTEMQFGFQEGILAGEQESITSTSKLNTIEDLSISPNPAKDRVNLTFDYTGTENLTVTIQNAIGQQVFRNRTSIQSGNTNFDINTSSWNNGLYFVVFETELAVRTELFSIAK